MSNNINPKTIFPTHCAPVFMTYYHTQIRTSTYNGWSRDSAVSIATRCGVDGPRIESRWRRHFPHLSRPALRPTQSPIQWVPGLSRG